MKYATTYDQLAAELNHTYLQLRGVQKYWIGLAGNPGSGKSTLAEALLNRLSGKLTVIPLDGFHYYRKELDDMEDVEEAYVRRGAPFTFNAEKFVSVIIAAHREGKGVFPDFDHHAGDPLENAITLSGGPQIVLVEGNYVLLNEKPWAQLQSRVFDETWFLEVPVSECNRRIVERHMQTGLTREEAQHRVETNDSINAALVMLNSPENADRIIRIV